jgi:PTH1 family peptidyl-tRNA hydrolase
MGLFQKKPQVSSSAPLYTVGLQKTLLVVGLGNIGKEYHGTRHNIGFAAIDEFASRLDFPSWVEKKDLKGYVSTQTVGDTRVILLKPTTFMNLSGEAVQAVSHFYKVPPEQILVVHDELDIPFGQIRTRMGGSDAGNNGVKSIIQQIGDGFGRIRVGVRNELAEKAASKDFVLGKFDKKEQEHLPELLRETTAILSEYAHGQPLAHETRSFIV